MSTYAGQMYDHTLEALKGWFHMSALDIDGTLSSNVNINSTNDPVQPGMVVHVSAVSAPGAGTNFNNGVPIPVFEMGASVTQMPIFLRNGTSGYDTTNPGVPAGTPLGGSGGVAGSPGSGVVPAWVSVRPTGKLSGLVATGGFELETTEFDTAQTYAVNDPLRAVTSNTNANAGKLTNKGNTGAGNPGFTASAFTVYTDTVVGIVSRGKYVNKRGKQALAFWSFFLPGTR